MNALSLKQATPMHFAVNNREPKNVEVLIKTGANLDLQDFEGSTPLHRALIQMFLDPVDTFEDYKKIIKILLFAGASRSIKDNQGLTPMNLLEENQKSITPK